MMFLVRDLGVFFIAASCLISSALYFFPAHKVPLRLMGSSVRAFVHSISGALFCTSILAVVVAIVHLIARVHGDVVTLMVSGFVGVILYVILTVKVNRNGYLLLMTLIKRRRSGLDA
jgi:hypothetical protein